MKCGERGKVTPSLLFLAKLSGGSGSNAPTIPVSYGSNGHTTCPTSCGGSFDPITAIPTARYARRRRAWQRRHSSALTEVTVGGPNATRGTLIREQTRRKFRNTR